MSIVEKWIAERYQQRVEDLLNASRLAWDYIMTGQGEKELTKAAQAVDWTPERLEQILHGYQQAKLAMQRVTAYEEKAKPEIARIQGEITQHQEVIRKHQEAIQQLRRTLGENESIQYAAEEAVRNTVEKWPPDVLQEAETALRDHFMRGPVVVVNDIPREVHDMFWKIRQLQEKMLRSRRWLEDDIRKIWDQVLALIREKPKP